MSSLPFQLIQPPLLVDPSPSSSANSQPSPQNATGGKHKLNRPSAISPPELHLQNSREEFTKIDDSASLQGIITNMKLILKLLQEHNDASREDYGRKPNRLAGILRILDEVRSRIQVCSHHSGNHNSGLCCCNSNLLNGPHPTSPASDCCQASPRGPLSRRHLLVEPSSPVEENQKLRRELSASMAARKSLEKMFSSLGREKEMIAGELARKVQELSCMEQHIADLRNENQVLSDKMRVCAAEHRGCCSTGSGVEEEMRAVQERNRELMEQLMRSLEGNKSAKRRLRVAQEEAARVREAVAEAIPRLRQLREKETKLAAKEEMVELEKVWEKLAKD